MTDILSFHIESYTFSFPWNILTLIKTFSLFLPQSMICSDLPWHDAVSKKQKAKDFLTGSVSRIIHSGGKSWQGRGNSHLCCPWCPCYLQVPLSLISVGDRWSQTHSPMMCRVTWAESYQEQFSYSGWWIVLFCRTKRMWTPQKWTNCAPACKTL